MSLHELTLPDLGFGDQPVTAGVWLVPLGSRVIEGDQILEVLAGESTVDLAAPASGVLVETLVAEGEQIEVGQVLGLIEEEE
jgi:pyruvate/2-oxoglutarate dehydrogenase complex dihydrolipoamide acyltransferase (E2) component